jgi:hypothetical protein
MGLVGLASLIVVLRYLHKDEKSGISEDRV